MLSVKMTDKIHWIGVNDRTTDLFEGMWPISGEGVSYNSFAIDDEKKALVDLAKAFKTDEYLERIAAVFPLEQLEYIIINHTEPDHTGALPLLCRLAPAVRILCTAKAKEMLQSFYGVGDRCTAVEDGQTLSLGKHTLEFRLTPFLHWPDTMMTYAREEKILFSCDAFGSYGALSGSLYDDTCRDLEHFEREALRYYANIVSLYSPMVLKAIARLEELGLEIGCVAPSHGLVWRRDPGRIVSLYKKWAEDHATGGERGVALLYASMYGNTEKYMNAVAQGLAGANMPVEIFDVARVHASFVSAAVLKYRGILLGVPTYEAGLFPPMAHQLDIIERKKMKHKVAGIFGSYLWSGGAQKEFRTFAEQLKWNVVEAEEFKGGPYEHELDAAFAFGKKFAADVDAACS